VSAGFPTLAQQKAAAATRIGQSCELLKAELAAYARAHGGRFVLYGSVARGDHRFDSDVDILVDFPEHEESAAWDLAEAACQRLELEVDLRSWRTASPRFLEHIQRDMKVIS
jgi:predicted nucleotidyltransferase